MCVTVLQVRSHALAGKSIQQQSLLRLFPSYNFSIRLDTRQWLGECYIASPPPLPLRVEKTTHFLIAPLSLHLLPVQTLKQAFSRTIVPIKSEMMPFILKIISCEGLQFICCPRSSNPSEHPEGSQHQPESIITRQPDPPQPMTTTITITTGAPPRVRRPDGIVQTASAPSGRVA